MRIAAVVDETLAQGFRAAGAQAITATDPVEAKATLRALLSDPDVAIVLVSGPASRAVAALEGELDDLGAVVLDLDEILR